MIPRLLQSYMEIDFFASICLHKRKIKLERKLCLIKQCVTIEINLLKVCLNVRVMHNVQRVIYISPCSYKL